MRILLSTVLLCVVVSSQAQVVTQTSVLSQDHMPQWVQLMYHGGDPVEVRQAYEAYYAEHDFQKNRDTQYYKRFMRNFQMTGDPHAFEGDDRRSQEEYLMRYHAQSRENGEWEEMGPWHYDPEVAMYFQVQSPGACHIYTVEQSASDPDVVWAGSATAGIWKSTDKGLHWSLMSRSLLVTAVYSIEIHPENPDIVYFGEDGGKIWKTTDGGNTWNVTGDESFQNLNLWVRDLRMKPDAPNVLFAATNQGLFRSENAGADWISVSGSEHMEVEFHPTNSDIVYSVALTGNNTLFKKSIDGGQNFISGAEGWPLPSTGEENRRVEMSVTAANPDRIYVLASGNANGTSGLFGIYVSDDQGESFSFQCCGEEPAGTWVAESNPNILGWSEDGTGDGGQYYYDLALAASPNQEDRLFGAGICVWRSLDAGLNWSLNAHWVTWAGEYTTERYTHADVHDIKFFETESGVDMWIASDGGLFYSSDQGDNIEPRMYGIHGTDFWGWQSGFRDGDVMLGGTYHNGTLIRNSDLYYWGADDEMSGGWLAELAGDNFRGFVNPGDASVAYHDGGAFRFSEDRFERISSLPFDNSKRPNTSYWFGEYGNLEWDPRCYNHVYSPVGSELWKSTNGGSNWELIHDFGGDKIIHVKVAPRNPDRIYITHRMNGSNWKIWRTDDGGNNWVDVSMTNAENGGNNNKAIYIDLDASNPDRLWAILLGDQNGNKVFTSTNAGDTWVNLTDEVIAGEYITSVAHQRGTEGGIYLGSRRAVYYKDDSMPQWELFSANLPAETPVVFLQPYYCEGKIRCAGSRGVHQNDFYTNSSPQAAFMADKIHLNLGLQCLADTVRFSDTSILMCEGASYSWSFEGGQADALDQAYAQVVYDTPGTYDVSLTVTDSEGNSATHTWQDMITVVDEPMGMPLAEDFNDGFPPANWKIESSGFGSWEQGTVLGDETNLVAQFPNYWVDNQGNADLLITPALDFSQIDDPVLFFDVAYRTYADYVDGLEVWYQVGDNEEWNPLYSKYGSELEVLDCYTWFWYDQGGQLSWRTDTVDLEVIAGEPCVTLAFANIGGYGNHIWLDNINISTWAELGLEEERQLTLTAFPNPTSGTVNLIVPTPWLGVPYRVYDMTGRVVAHGLTVRQQVINLSNQAAGVYVLDVSGHQQLRVIRK